MHDLIIFGIGLVAGASMMIFLIAMLKANKPDEIMSEKLKSYEEGYQVGFDDGYELRKKQL
jgi:hypothetical protein